MRRNRRRTVLAAITLTGMLTIGACSHGSHSGDAGGSGGAAVAGSAGSVSSADSVIGSGGSVPATAEGATAGRSVTQTSLVQGTSRIRTADLTVAIGAARDVAGRADRAGVIAQGAGGEVDSDNRSTGSRAQADLVLRVPQDSLSAVLTALSRLGKEKSRRLATTDVTERVADVTSRVASAQQAVARLRELYARAAKVADVIAIESELSSREADLESLQAQQRALARQTSMATITLTLRTATVAAAQPSREHSGFLGGLRRGWDAFTSAATSVSSSAGAALPFLVLLLALAALGQLVRARIARRSRSVPAPSPAE